MPPIHVIGLGVRSPFGVGPDALLDRLCRGDCAIEPYEPFADAGLRSPVAAPIHDDLRAAEPGEPWWDRGTRMLWAAVCDALVDACGHANLQSLGAPPHRIALITGTSASGVGRLSEAMRSGQPLAHSDATYNAATLHVARRLGIQGPVLVIGSVCASGALAIAEAAELVEQGTVDVAIVAGFDPLEPFVGAGFDTLGATSDQPWPFRLGRRGLVLGEAAAALVLARAPGGARRGVLAGWGSSTDAHHLTAPHPQGEGVVLAINRALACAQMGPNEIGVINSHGTGTQFNDAMESIAIHRVWGDRARQLPVHTVKGAIGHTLGAAGAIEAVVSLEALHRKMIPPTLTHGDPDPACDLDLVVDSPRASDATTALSISAGFGGINCVLILSQEASFKEPSPVQERNVLVRSSAIWIAGRWIDRLEELDLEPLEPSDRFDLGLLTSNRRLQRADRTTRLGAMVVARALQGLETIESVSVLTASATVSSHSNSSWEQRRIDRGRPDPRTFAYTATNAVAGEVAAALVARGPSIALIGSGSASLAALHRARHWVATGQCDRAIVLAYECPAEHSEVGHPRATSCGVALVLEPTTEAVRWHDPVLRTTAQSDRLLSVEPLARWLLSSIKPVSPSNV